MKRSQALAPLSQQHHTALFVALGLRRVDGDDAAEAVAAFLTFFAEADGGHLALEERLLVDALPAPLARRMLSEHADLRRRAVTIRQEPSGAAARALGELLAAHVRFEEREVFPTLERTLPAEELDRIGGRLSARAA
jgi:hemerythrin-like domain-containing protein